MTHFKTILITLVTVGPLIKGDTDRKHDRRLVCYDRVLENGEHADRASVFFSGEDAHHAQFNFGQLMELTYCVTSNGSKVAIGYKYI